MRGNDKVLRFTNCFLSTSHAEQKVKSVGRKIRLTTANVYRTHFSTNKNMFSKAVQMMLTSR